MEALPAVNATLNGFAALLLITGWCFIKRRQITAHKICMIAAFVFSALFLGCYLLHKFSGGGKWFPGSGIWKSIYLLVLIPHIILAVAMLPMIFVTFYRAYRGDFPSHARIARWTLPIWLYVSVTGVVVYIMLYQITW